MPTWLISTICGIGLWGLFGFTSKLALSQSMDYLTFNLIDSVTFMLTALAVPWVLAGGAAAPRLGRMGTSLALITGVLACIGQAAFFAALNIGPASEVVPLCALYPAVTIVLSVVFLKVRLSARQILGIGLALVGGFALAS